MSATPGDHGTMLRLFASIVALGLGVIIGAGDVAWGQALESHYVAMDDGVRLAVDVHFPDAPEGASRWPAMLEITRYWRAAIDPESGKAIRALNHIDREFLAHGYAIVKVDVRGTGASFGSRREEYGPREIRDGYAIVDWVASQPWSDGNVGAYGISYTGTTAELLCSSNHPALKAVIPGWSDFDLFTGCCRPYGLSASTLMNEWGQMVGWMDENNVEKMGGSVRPVDPSLLSSAVREHDANPEFAKLGGIAEYRDVGYLGGHPMGECSSIHWKDQIESSKVPMLVFASWLDAGTADGALLRFQHYSNPQFVVIMASSHGGFAHASPYAVSKSLVLPIPRVPEQLAMWIAFADHYLKGTDNDVPSWPKLRYFNMGEEKMRESGVWPPVGTKSTAWYLDADRALVEAPPATADGSDVYTVDFEVDTGTSNRWMTQMGRPIFQLDRREAMDERMQCYTTPPLAADLQITGTPEVHLWLSSSHPDAAVIAYLEDVSPDGQSRYITEGGLRLIHRKITPNTALPHDILPHSYAQADARPMSPGVVEQVSCKMWPTSARISAGHRLRIAIAGADRTTFARMPAEGDVELTLYRNADRASHVSLPVVEER